MQRMSSEMDEGGRLTSALKDVRIMNDEALTFGLPSFLFFGGLAMSLACAFMLPWFIGLLFGIIYFMVMYRIHADDPKALQVWVEAIRRPQCWLACRTSGRAVFYLVEED